MLPAKTDPAERVSTPRPRSARALKAARGLLAELFSSSLSLTDREHLAETFAAAFHGAGVREALLERLANGDEDDRAIAALALGAPGNGEVTGALTRGLSDPSARVRRACARALGEIAEERAGEALLEALEGRGQAEDQLTLIACLHRARHPRGREVLLGALGHAEVEVQLAALGALSRAPCARAVGEARRLLAAPDARVRGLAAAVLERAGEGHDLDAVRALLEDADARVRAIARDAASALERRWAQAS